MRLKDCRDKALRNVAVLSASCAASSDSSVLHCMTFGCDACLWEEEGRQPKRGRLATALPSLHVAQSHSKITQPSAQWQLRRVPRLLPRQRHLQWRMQQKRLEACLSTPAVRIGLPVDTLWVCKSAGTTPGQMTMKPPSAPGPYSWQQAPGEPDRGPQGSYARLLQAAGTCKGRALSCVKWDRGLAQQ